MARGDKFVVPQSIVAEGRLKQRARRDAARGLTMQSARDFLAGIEMGGHVFGVTKGQFSMIDVADALLEIAGPSDVSVWTWCIADYEVEAVTAFMRDGRIRSLRMVVDYSSTQRETSLLADIQARFGVDSIRVTKTHAKLLTVFGGGWSFVARGSMNLNANRRLEQVDVTADDATFRAIMDVEAEIWAAGKALPVANVGHADADRLLDKLQEPEWLAEIRPFRI